MAVCPVATYARSVLSGDVPAGKLIRLACQRHLGDLEAGSARGLRWDAEAARRALQFFSFLKHSKGEWAGKGFQLSPWQEFVLGCLFGWKRADGLRRFRIGYCEVPRKNGKSTLAAGVGLYLFVADGEAGAEVYTCATKRDQARITHSEATAMVRASPALKKRVVIFKDNLNILANRCKFEPLGSDADSTDGLNVHGAVCDELHAWKKRLLWDVLETATGARREPLLFAITTAGFDRHSVCWELHDYAVKVLEGVIPDDRFFAFVATIDQGDRWDDPAAWAKANPNLGISVKRDDLQGKAEKAKQLPGAQNAFRRLHLNEWTEQAERWIDLDVWDACHAAVDLAALAGAECYAGIDLASTTDVAALVLLFPAADGSYDVLPYFWVPEENLRRRAERDHVPYDVWARQAFIETTPGNVIDYDLIRKRINELDRIFCIRYVAIDRWNSTQLAVQLLGDGLKVEAFGQGFASMTAPTKQLEALLLQKRLRHGGHPVLRWMASNVAVKQDAAGNLKPDKGASFEKIDGIVALIMAVGGALLRPVEASIYDSQGLLTTDGTPEKAAVREPQSRDKSDDEDDW